MSELPGRFIACLLLALAVPAGALAQDEHDDPIAERPDGEAAREAFEAGMQAFDAGDYEQAITSFQRTYELAPHPDVQFNIYSAAERAGQLELAEQALDSYLLNGEPGDRRPVLVGRLQRLRERIAEAEAEARVREEAAAEAEAAARAEAAAAARAEAEAQSRREPARQPAPPPPPEGVHPAGPILLVSAGVLLASFGVFAGLAAAEDSALAADCGRDEGRTCTADQVAGLEGLTLAADIAWISASVVGVAGLVLLFALPPEEGMSLSVLPWATPTAAGVSVGGTL